MTYTRNRNYSQGYAQPFDPYQFQAPQGFQPPRPVQAPYNPSYNGAPMSQPYKKRSRAKFTTITKGESEGYLAVNAFKYIPSRRTALRISAFPLRTGGKIVESESRTGKIWIPYIVEMVDINTGSKNVYTGLLDVDKKRLYIQSLGWIITATNGGYVGQGGHKMQINNRR